MDSISSTSTVTNVMPWTNPVAHTSPLGQLSQMPKLRISQTSSSSEHTRSGQSSPPTTSPHPTPKVSLPGYRESMHPQTLPWREPHRDHEMQAAASRLPQLSNPRRSYPLEPTAYPPSQASHGVGQSPSAPPLLSYDSTGTSWSSLSSGSTNSSLYFQPRTPIGPLEPQVDRPQVSLPSLFPGKGSGFYEGNQLPPLRPPSLSPHTSLDGAPSTSVVTNVEYSMPQVHALRNYQRHSPSSSISGPSLTQTSNPPSQQGLSQVVRQNFQTSGSQQGFQTSGNHHIQSFQSNADGRGPISDKDLDPMSALIRAGEIVSGNSSRQRQL